MAVRPDSMVLAGLVPANLPQLALDELKYIVPCAGQGTSAPLPLDVVALLVWPDDCDESGPGTLRMIDVAVPGRDRGWINTWRVRYPDWQVIPHPDGPPWWRIRSAEHLTPERIASALQEAGARYGGWHERSCRRPDFRAAPTALEIDADAMAMALLAHTFNGHAVAAAIGEHGVWEAVQRAVFGVRTMRVVPGCLDATHRLLVEAVRN
jgi:hypothetical protein